MRVRNMVLRYLADSLKAVLIIYTSILGAVVVFFLMSRSAGSQS